MRIFFLAAFALAASLTSAPFPRVNQHNAVRPLQLTEPNGDWNKCTGTAVGPHALLTAAHCNDDKAKLTIHGQAAEIVSRLFDGHDHMLLLVRGVAFPDYVSLKNTRALQGEVVHFWGYPVFADEGSDQYRECYMTGQAPLGPDDAHVADLYACPVAPGDSGSALFNASGNVVGVVSAREGEIMASYPLLFTSAQLAQATTF